MVALIAAVAIFLSVAMALAWEIQRRTTNSGWADVVWSFATGAAGVIFALAPLDHAPLPPRQILIACLVTLWSVRLGLHLLARTRSEREDARYAHFRAEWGSDFQRRMFWFLQIQAAASALLCLSMLFAARNPHPLGWLDAAGLAVLIIAVTGEGLSDAQLRRYRASATHGAICDQGFWKYSRHPNYFFEWLGWCAYPLFALSGGNWIGVLALTGPAFMYVLLVHVSGIPPLEQHMERSRGPAWRLYVARTRPFLPLP